MKKTFYITGILLLLLIAGYFIANAMIRHKVDEALRGLPSSMKVTYRHLHADVLTGSLDIEGVQARYMPVPAQAHEVTIEKIAIRGLSVFAWLRSHRLRVRDVRLEGVTVKVDEDLMEHDSSLQAMKTSALDALVGGVEVKDLVVEGIRKGKRSFSFAGKLWLDSVTTDTAAAVRLVLDTARYVVPYMGETVRLSGLEVDSRKRSLKIDSFRIAPDGDKEEMGRSKGRQVDVVWAYMAGIAATGLDVMGLIRHRFHAYEISFHGSRIHVFRDRRLPLEPGEKPMPVESLKSLPIDLRVGKVRLGKTRFEYEEFPKVGERSGALVIEGFRASLAPLLNRPRDGDPAFITLTTEGSLMGSGLVTATTRMPLQKGAPYEVEGAFHDLDVTRLNNPAENLGQLHLESGMLNSLDFQFEMGEERATGKIVGVYHDLVVDKLKEKNGQLKTDKLKSFALAKLIIPRDKDKSLPVSKRTGKVDYKRDKERYFSYYLLHSLLVGVKSSFSLGFLLPG